MLQYRMFEWGGFGNWDARGLAGLPLAASHASGRDTCEAASGSPKALTPAL